MSDHESVSDPNEDLDEEECCVNLLSFVTNCDALMTFFSPNTIRSITKLLGHGPEISNLSLLNVPDHPCLLDLAQTLTQASFSSFTISGREKPGKGRPIIQLLASVCRTEGPLERLWINGLPLKEDDAKVLSDAMTARPPPRLSSLKIRYCTLKQAAFPTLMSGIRKLRTLTSLRLEDNNMGDGLAKELAESLFDLPLLTELRVSSENLSPQGAKVLGAAWSRKVPKFEALDLNHNHMKDEGIGDLVEGLKGACGSLQKLNLGDNDLEEEGSLKVARLVANCQHLVKLSLASTKFGEDSGTALGKALKPCARTLERLNLSACSLGAKGTAAVCHSLRGAPRLRSLNLGYNCVGDSESEVVAEDLLASSPNLEKLNISGNEFSEAATRTLARGLAKNFSLRVLDVGFSSEMGIAGILDAFKGGHPLRELILARSKVDDKAAEALARLLMRVNGVKKIKAVNSEITPKGIKSIAKAVEKASELEELDLDYNLSLGDESAECIAEEIIGKSRSLRRLHIRRIGIKTKGAIAIINAVKNRDENSVLERIYVEKTDCGRGGVSVLQKSDAETRSIFTFDLF